MDKNLQKFYSDLNDSRGDPCKLVAFYDKAAKSYDDIMHDSGYTATTDYCASLLKDTMMEYPVVGADEVVLDVGCGTGKTGSSLMKAGFTEVDGVDPSVGSLEVAKETGSYRRVFEGMITHTEKLKCNDESYTGVFCIGCMTIGHLELTNGVAEFIRILKHGGIAVYTISNTLDKAKALEENVVFVKNKQIEILRLERRFYHALGAEKSYCDIYVIRKL